MEQRGENKTSSKEEEERKNTKNKIESNPGKKYSSMIRNPIGTFLVRKSDIETGVIDPPLWRTDGLTLIQQFSSQLINGDILHKKTKKYVGWAKESQNDFFKHASILRQRVNKDASLSF